MAGPNDVHWTQTQVVGIQGGATLARFFQCDGAQTSWVVKSFSGGSLALVGCSLGMTLTAAQLVTASAAGYYQLGSAEALSISGPASFYLMAQGDTAVAHVIKGYGSRA